MGWVDSGRFRWFPFEGSLGHLVFPQCDDAVVAEPGDRGSREARTAASEGALELPLEEAGRARRGDLQGGQLPAVDGVAGPQPGVDPAGDPVLAGSTPG